LDADAAVTALYGMLQVQKVKVQGNKIQEIVVSSAVWVSVVTSSWV
jgi:hypothetical protein